MKALVTGATGVIGPALIRHLQSRGWEVRAMVRRAPEGSGPPIPAEVIVGDVLDPNDVERAALGIDCVFHLAAKLHEIPVIGALDTQTEAVNVGGTQNVVGRSSGQTRIVYFSTICVYGSTMPPAIATEETTPNADTTYARTKLEAEKVILSSGRGTVLRFASVYGPGMKGNYVRLVRAICRGRFFPIGAGENRRTLIHLTDAVRAAELGAQAEPGQIFNITDGSVHTLHDIISAIYSAAGRRQPRHSAPARVLRSLAKIVDSVAPLRIGALVDKYLEDVAVSGEKAIRTLGFSPQMPLREGWRTVVARLCSDGSEFERTLQ